MAELVENAPASTESTSTQQQSANPADSLFAGLDAAATGGQTLEASQATPVQQTLETPATPIIETPINNTPATPTTPVASTPVEPDFVALYNKNFGTEFKSIDEYKAYRQEAEELKKTANEVRTARESLPVGIEDNDLKILQAFKKGGYESLKELVDINTRDIDSVSNKDLIKEHWMKNDGKAYAGNDKFRERAFNDYYKSLYEYDREANLDLLDEDHEYNQFTKSVAEKAKADTIRQEFKAKKEAFVAQKVEGVTTASSQQAKEKEMWDHYLKLVNDFTGDPNPKSMSFDIDGNKYEFKADPQKAEEMKLFMLNPGGWLLNKAQDEKGEVNMGKLFEMALLNISKNDLASFMLNQGKEKQKVDEIKTNMNVDFSQNQPSTFSDPQKQAVNQLFDGLK